MGCFKNIFNNSEIQTETSNMNWIQLTDSMQLNEIIENSNQKPILIFKHSTRCAISRMVLKQFENDFKLDNDFQTYFLDLLQFRPISNEIESLFHVQHQSPQILLVKNGVVVHHTSHESIDAETLGKFMV